MSADLEREVIEIIARQNQIDPSRVTATSTFEDLGLNSLAAIELLFAVEERFGVTIPDETTQSMRNVGHVVEALRSLRVTPPAGAG